MSARAVVLGVILAVSLASCTVAQEAPQGLTERQAEVAAVVESLAKALMAGDLEAIKQGVQFPLLAVAVMGAEPPRIEEITEELLTPDATSAALARYGMAKQVQLVQPSVALPAFNVAVYASEIQWQNEAGDALVRDRMAGLFSKRG